MKLFKVTSKKYKEFYVIADDYNSAMNKATEYRKNNSLDVSIDNDGSLVIAEHEIKEDELYKVELLTEDIIK